jgi:hypothetical protein
MSNNKLIIPNTINVGYQVRQDTYTKKLAYVIYTDNAGVLRKQKSWDQWRDKSITPDEFKNEPTSGFVLNKKVGDYRGSWDGRQAWIRIYDPRDFEFEISVNNLLFILEECSSIKGKGLEGEFVYAWDGKDLVLLPVSSKEYKDSLFFTDLTNKKSLKKSDLKEGYTYIHKDTSLYLYLGFMDYYTINVEYGQKYRDTFQKCSRSHVFKNLSNNRYVSEVPKNIKAIHSEVVAADFSSIFDDYKSSNFGQLKKVEWVKVEPPKLDDVTYATVHNLFAKINNNYYVVAYHHYLKLLSFTLKVNIVDNKFRLSYEDNKNCFYSSKYKTLVCKEYNYVNGRYENLITLDGRKVDFYEISNEEAIQDLEFFRVNILEGK